jgi:hypothetical protein
LDNIMSINIGLLTTEIIAAGLPITGIAVLPLVADTDGYGPTSTFYTRAEGKVRVDWVSVPSGPRNASAAAIIDAFDASQAAQDAAELAAVRAIIDARFANANGKFDDVSLGDRLISLLAMDEVNILRELWMSFKAEAAASDSLANFQARIAALPDTPPRVAAQIKTAIRNRADS